MKRIIVIENKHLQETTAIEGVELAHNKVLSNAGLKQYK